MKKIKILAPAGIFLLLLCFSCTKETVNNITNNGVTPGQPTINIFGGVFQYQKNSINYQTIPLQGVKVSIDSASVSGITDSTGVFSLNKVPDGIYTLNFHKSGYGDINTYNNQFQGSGDEYISGATMNRIPAVTFYNFSDTPSVAPTSYNQQDSTWLLNGTISVKNTDSSLITGIYICYGFSPDFTLNQNNILYNSNSASLRGLPVSYSMNFTNLVYTLKSAGLPYHGVTIYLKIYPTPVPYYYGDYRDPVKGEQYTSVGTPLSAQFIIP